MASTIDVTKPLANSLLVSQDIRDLAIAARNDIEALQAMQTSGSGTGVNFYLTGTASGIGSYDIMQKSPDSAIEAIESCVVNNNTVLLDAYILDTEVNRILLNGGEWAFDFFHYVSSVHGATHLTYEIYKRTSGGVETLLFSVDSETITALTVQNYITKTIQQGFAVTTTDKIVLKIYASTTFNGNITVYLVHSGTLHYSHIMSPLVYTHNELESKQGGTTNEYYHLTAAEHTTVGNTSGTNTGDETPTTAGVLIANATAKTTPVDADYLGLMDSAASNVLKKVSWLNLNATLKTYFDTLYAASGSGSETTTTMGTLISGATSKNPPIDADSWAILDSVSGLMQRVTGTNLKAYLKTYFDTLYAAAGSYITASSTDTLTNKRITMRVGSTNSSATPIINTDNVDVYKLTAQTVDITSFTTNLSGIPTDWQELIIEITGTAARAITWGASSSAGLVALSTTTTTTKTLTVGFKWDSTSSKWVCMSAGSYV